MDEAGQKKFKVGSWEAILRRVGLYRGRVLITTTIYTLGWLKPKLYDRWQSGDPDVEVVNFSSVANPLFTPEEFERARRDLPAWKFRMQYLGQFTRPAGLIYDCYNPTMHKVPRFVIPKGWHRYLGLDFGTVNMAGVFLAEEPETRRLYLYRAYQGTGESVAGHVRKLLQHEPGIPFAVGGSKSEKDWRKEFRGAGLPVREPRIVDVEVGIDRVYGCIQRGEVFVFDDLDEFEDELTTYSRVLDEHGEPTEAIEDKQDYHLMDAMRYVLGFIRDLGSVRQQQILVQRVDPLMELDQEGF